MTDELRDEIARAFADDFRRFPGAPGLRDRMLQHAMDADGRRPRRWEWVLPAAAVGLAVIAVLLLLSLRGLPTASQPASPPTPVPTPVSGPPSTAPATPTPAPTATPVPAAPPTASPSATTDRCHTGDLSATIRGQGAAAGNRYAALVLTNRSTRVCWVYGYVGMQLQDAAGHAVPTKVVRTSLDIEGSGALSSTMVTLPPGATAYTPLHWGAVPGTGDAESYFCQPEASSTQVTPPDETTQLVIPWTFGPVCEQGQIDINPLRAGTGPS